jgi:hypothetical protein
MVVWDLLAGSGVHTVELNWHSLEELHLEADGLSLPAGLKCRISGADSLAVNSAVNSPFHGWRAPSYGAVVPAFTLTAHYSGTLPCELTTFVWPVECASPASPDVDVEAFRLWCQ